MGVLSLTHKEAVLEYDFFGYKLIENFKGTNHAHLVESANCNHVIFKRLDSLRRRVGLKCGKCSGRIKRTQEEAEQEYLKHGFILKEPYRNNSYKHLVENVTCGHKTSKTLKNTIKKHKCSICTNRKYTNAQAVYAFKDLGLVLLELYNGDIRKPHGCVCINKQHRTNKNLMGVLQKYGCRLCAIFKSKIYNKITSKIVKNLRTAMSKSIKQFKNNKKASAIKDLGCSVEFFIKYMESKFYTNPETGEAMAWENYGKYGWHVDHIRPLVSFNWENKEDQKKAVHYTNLQPLWAFDNLSKGANYSVQ